MGYICSTCGKYHDEIPMDFGFDKPFYYDPNDESSAKTLTSDTFILNNEHYFVRGVLPIPVNDLENVFNYGIWVSLSKQNFTKYMNVYGTEKELDEPAYFGWLSNTIKGYPETLSLKTHVHLQGAKNRPKIELELTDHPLSQEQHNGISIKRLHEMIDFLLKHEKDNEKTSNL